MMHDVVRLRVLEQPVLTGACELCAAANVRLVAGVVVDHMQGGRMQFIACERCARAARRLAAALGASGPGSAVTVEAADAGGVSPATTPPTGGAAPAELILQPDLLYTDEGGRRYAIQVYGSERADGTWIGWIEFAAYDTGAVLRTGRETTQPNRDALTYWAAGLEPVYFDGAFSRAR